VADETEKQAEEKEQYVSDQVSLKMWSVIGRFLHEGWGIVSLHKAWDREIESFNIVPTFSGQIPEAMKPNVWMSWRHELKAPLGGHTFVRDYAEIIDAVPLQSAGALAAIEAEHALTSVEALRRYQEGEPGLIALVLRVYHLPRSYKLGEVAKREGGGKLVSLPFDVELNDLTPAVEDEDFERRVARIRAALG
jgi:hypothetical protein